MSNNQRQEPGKNPVAVSDKTVPLSAVSAVAVEGAPVCLSDDPVWQNKISAGRAFLDKALEEGQTVYGVSTGIGNTSSISIDPNHRNDFAYQIIRQHGCGLGEPLGKTKGRAVVFARLISLSKGYSAVRIGLLQQFCHLLNHDIIPVIPSLGSVGASGDLTPLSYVASVIVGEREAYTKNGIRPAAEALQQAGLKPYTFAPKESLAIMNGTAVMTALASLAVAQLDYLMDLSDAVTALVVQVMKGRTGAFHPTAHQLKHHEGEILSAQNIRAALAGSLLVDGPEIPGRLAQDPYSMRCAPHVIGAARDALAWTKHLIENELNSVNDNPLVDPENGEIIFAGNFYGGHISLSMDLLKTAMVSVMDLLDRQFSLLVDSRMNSGLPETLVAYRGCGLKGMHMGVTAITARAAQKAASDVLQSRSTEAHNQDKVSMGMNAALSATEITGLFEMLLAMMLVTVSNAASLREENDFSPAARQLLEQIRSYSIILDQDRRLDQDLALVINAIKQQSIIL